MSSIESQNESHCVSVDMIVIVSLYLWVTACSVSCSYSSYSSHSGSNSSNSYSIFFLLFSYSAFLFSPIISHIRAIFSDCLSNSILLSFNSHPYYLIVHSHSFACSFSMIRKREKKRTWGKREKRISLALELSCRHQACFISKASSFESEFEL